jgi:hypothetical protein
LDDKKAAEWCAILKHPSKVPPSKVEGMAPEGDFEAGFVHPCVAAEFPNKNIELFNIIEEPTDKIETVASPALVEAAPDAELPQEEGGDPTDLILTCPFGGGLRCRTMGGSGSPWHHFHSDSMKAHIEKIGEGNLEVPKMGTFKGQPALFFTNNDEPYVALPLTQEIHSKSGVVYKWSFLAEGPFAIKQPMVSKVMNQLAQKKPLILPNFNIPEPVVSIAHDAVPAEDPVYSEFHPDVFPLIRDEFPRPGSVISLGIVKGDRIFAVVTDKSLDFYDELGKEVYYPAADGLYYAYFDLTGKTTPAFVLVSFVNVFLPSIDTTALEDALEAPPPEEAPEVPQPVNFPTVANAGYWAQPTSTDAGETSLAKSYIKAIGSLEGQIKPSKWFPFDTPPLSVWVFFGNSGKMFLCNDSYGNSSKATYSLRSATLGSLQIGTLDAIRKYLMQVGEPYETTQLGGLLDMNIPETASYLDYVDSEPQVESLIDISKGFPSGFNPVYEYAHTKVKASAPLTPELAKSLLLKLEHGWTVRMSGAPVSVLKKAQGWGCYSKQSGKYSFLDLDGAVTYLVSHTELAFSKYNKADVTFSLFGQS